PGPSEVSSSTSAAPKHTPQTTRADHPLDMRAQLAETGTDQSLIGASAASAALLLGGAILYRRSRGASSPR
ncbi:LPXTG cell wall anchor domain-containing protein, partial [Streptomyces flavofungini]|uniref:LPXTG cell wall anchor domain-containing protein n=1 Tax=Streptomyces flavofungini TaxID=68200 RepID=UPI0034DF8595